MGMPAGRQVSGMDRTLLADIATKAGLGMRNAQLAAQLRVQVDQSRAQTRNSRPPACGCWPPRRPSASD